MFAAAATIAQMAFDLSVSIAKWLSTKTFVISLLTIVLSWVLKGVFIWAFQYFTVYGREISDFILTSISDLLSSGSGSYDVNIALSGVGGYLALQTGLIDYCSIIFTGWGLYWVIAILAKTTRVI